VIGVVLFISKIKDYLLANNGPFDYLNFYLNLNHFFLDYYIKKVFSVR
jgi:hypothetical protein